MAKNSMQMVFGYSSNQIVFGTNPNLPGVMTDGPPALDGKTASEVFEKHWKALHAAREAFTKSESCSRLRRALLSKVCSNNTIFEPGDQVYYKSKRQKKWLGPAKVIFQDGKVIFIRHGSVYVRASPSHLTKRGMEMWREPSHQGEKTHSLRTMDKEVVTAEPKRAEEDRTKLIELTDDETEPAEGNDTSPQLGNRRQVSDQLLGDRRQVSDQPLGDCRQVSDQPLGDRRQVSDQPPGDRRQVSGQPLGDRRQVSDQPRDNRQDEPLHVVLDPPDSIQNGLRELSIQEQSLSGSSDIQGETLEPDVQADTEVLADGDETEECEEGTRKRKKTVVRAETGKRKAIKVNHRPRRMIFPPNTMEKIKLKKDDRIKYKVTDEWHEGTIISREKVGGRFYNYFNILGDDGLPNNVDLERVEYEKIDRDEEVNLVMIPFEEQSSDACKEAKKIELQKLKDFDSYREVPDDGQFRISTTWVMWMKGEETRARMGARGYEEKDKVPSDSPTVEKGNIRLLLTICQSKGWEVESSDVKSAFLQGRKLDRKVTLKPPKEANVARGILWELNVALYGLDDASLQFHFECKDKLLKLGCVQSEVDPCVFYHYNRDGELDGVLASHVDDFLHGGDEGFRGVIENLRKVFKMGSTEREKFKYVGFNINQSRDHIEIDQNDFADEKVEIFDVNPVRAKNAESPLTAEEKSSLRKVAGKVGWLARGTRPDLAFHQVEICTKFLNGRVKDLVSASKLVRKVKGSVAKIRIPDLGPVNEWKVEVSTDAALSNLNEGVDSAGAQLVLIVGRDGKCSPISWQSNKIKRIVGSTLEAESLSLVEGLKEGQYVKEMIEEAFNLKENSIPMEAIVDNKSTYDAVHSTSTVSDKKLRRDIGSIKQQLNRGELRKLLWRPGNEQLADAMTKKTASSYELMKVFQTGQR